MPLICPAVPSFLSLNDSESLPSVSLLALPSREALGAFVVQLAASGHLNARVWFIEGSAGEYRSIARHLRLTSQVYFYGTRWGQYVHCIVGMVLRITTIGSLWKLQRARRAYDHESDCRRLLCVKWSY